MAFGLALFAAAKLAKRGISRARKRGRSRGMARGRRGRRPSRRSVTSRFTGGRTGIVRRRRVRKMSDAQMNQAERIARNIGKTAGANYIDRVLR